MPSKKKVDLQKIHEERREERENRAQTVNQKFSGIDKIEILLTFEDPDQHCTPNPQTIKYKPQDKAFFEVKCPFSDCIQGGFDLSSHVEKCISQRGIAHEGDILCLGWQDAERVGQHRCLLKARFKILVEYIPTQAAKSETCADVS